MASLGRNLTVSELHSWSTGLQFLPMDIDSAREIADRWKYPAPYDFYDVTADPGDYREFVSPQHWPDLFLKALLGGEGVGYCSLGLAEGRAEIALGLRPDLTGRGLGEPFMRACLREVAPEVPGGYPLKLEVAAFNRRAIKVYERVGFTAGRRYSQATNGGQYQFIEMTLRPGQGRI